MKEISNLKSEIFASPRPINFYLPTGVNASKIVSNLKEINDEVQAFVKDDDVLTVIMPPSVIVGCENEADRAIELKEVAVMLKTLQNMKDIGVDVKQYVFCLIYGKNGGCFIYTGKKNY